jgi:hypothetical protein
MARTFHNWRYPVTEEFVPLFLILSIASVIIDFIHRLAMLRIAFWKIIILHFMKEDKDFKTARVCDQAAWLEAPGGSPSARYLRTEADGKYT